MITLLKNVDLYSPAHEGRKDILISGKKIAAIENKIEISGLPGLHIYDGKGQIAVPGFIDNHVHITGGGGESSFASRTSEITENDMIKAGVTSVIGVRGTDGYTRSMENLIAKAKAIRENGLSCWIMTGSYQVPVRTITGNIESDIILIEEIIGAGEIAIADHRSSHPCINDLISIAASARIGGMLAGKSGIVIIHLGDGKHAFSFLNKCIEQSDIPVRHFFPTHVNRNYELLCQGFSYAEKGGFIDLTTSGYVKGKDDKRTKCSHALKLALEENIPIEHISFSSDGQGSIPVFGENKEPRGFTIGSCTSLLTELRDAVKKEKIPLEVALKVITQNPARVFQLTGKGELNKGFDADIVLLDKDFSITTVLAKGIFLMDQGNIIFPRVVFE
ncbi:beta-aspartyl-peptidase [Desulfobacula sp.]